MGPLVRPMGLSRVAPGRFEAELDASWNLRPLPQGGILSALAAQAMADSLGDPSPPGVPAMAKMAFWSERVEGRNVVGRAPWDDAGPGRAEQVNWYRFDDPPVLHDGSLDPLALVVVADTMPGAVGQRVGRQDRPWFAPSVDLTVHLLDHWRSRWILGHNRARHAGDGYASLEMALWDCGDIGEEAPRLVAYATQICLFTFAEQEAL